MKYFLFLVSFMTICILGSCSDASTNPSKKEFPTYKHSFTGKISNPKNITIPDDAYIVCSWLLAADSPNYVYYYGDGNVNKTTNTFTISFKDTLPLEAVQRSEFDPGSFSAGTVFLVTSPSKLSGKDSNGDKINKEAKVWGALNWGGIIYVGADSVSKWFEWSKVFKPGFTYANGVEKGQTQYFVEASPIEMEILIDTNIYAFSFPRWWDR